MSKKSLRTPPEIESLAQQIGDFIEYWGFKNVHGRIWTHIFVSDEPLDAGDLIQRLGISKALASMSISDLLEYDVIQLAGKSERGTTTYKANPEVTQVILNVLRKRERRMLSHIAAAFRLVEGLDEEQTGPVKLNSRRVECLGQMITTAEQSMDAFLRLSEIDFKPWTEFNHIPETDS